MKILVYGAGVIGSIYAAKLYAANYDVTLLARSNNYESLKQSGIIIKNSLTGNETANKISVTKYLEATDFYDLVIVTTQLGQLDSVIPALKNNNRCPLIMFMLNNPEHPGILIEALKPKHIILGFPGVGGADENNIINYIQIKQQKTTIGEINGESSDCIKQIKILFEKAGFKTFISNDIVSWLKVHAVFIACMAAAIIKENGSCIQLGEKRGSIKIMVKSIREGFAACKALSISIMPINLKIVFMIMPQWFSILYWQKAMQGNLGTLAIAPHANKAKDEMKLVAEKVLEIVHSSHLPAPTLENLLCTFIKN
ncbi:MAG TPA: 2-dehydropantoate 2-reductase N-terminal domain-containing protein [Puia sp.]|jgi:2-dehydropantoate 2-reductase|nr:2-dehydropantoate 2-reductase N-terminal domain-containing protein [Puia sp.]